MARASAVAAAGSHSVAPVLDATSPRRDGLLERCVGPGRPVRTFAAGIVVAYVAVAGLSVLLGLLLVHVVLRSHGIAADDERFVRFLARHRSRDLTDASLVGSIIAGGVVLPIIAGVCALAMAVARQWRVAAFFVFVLGLESGSYRTTTLLVHRHRPFVHRLESLDVHASYPSGHTAASIAVYCGLALLLTSRISNRAAQIGIWTIALAIPPYVALARMYRGMHHPLDVLGGVVVGVASLVALVLICRATGRASSEKATATP